MRRAMDKIGLSGRERESWNCPMLSDGNVVAYPVDFSPDSIALSRFSLSFLKLLCESSQLVCTNKISKN